MLDAYDAARQSEEGDEDVDLASEDDDDEDNMRRLAEHGLPVKSAADFDDEEIDEDTAFTAEDEERYGSLFRVR